MKKQMVSLAAVAIVSSAFAAQASADSTHTVKKGDTLWELSKKYNTSVAQLKKWNNLSSDFLQINQKLIISGDSSTTSKPNAPANQPQAKNTYKVVSGDTLSKIAKQHNMSVKTLKDLNKLTSDLIFPGQSLPFLAMPAEVTITIILHHLLLRAEEIRIVEYMSLSPVTH